MSPTYIFLRPPFYLFLATALLPAGTDICFGKSYNEGLWMGKDFCTKLFYWLQKKIVILNTFLVQTFNKIFSNPLNCSSFVLFPYFFEPCLTTAVFWTINFYVMSAITARLIAILSVFHVLPASLFVLLCREKFCILFKSYVCFSTLYIKS